MKIVFVSNYINHHQIPFCDAMSRECEGQFLFIQTEPMEEERVHMGWQDHCEKSYLRYYYKEAGVCHQLIQESDVVLFGGCDDESYIEERLRSGKLVIRISERLYKTGQWKAISPRGLLKKYHDHSRYRKAAVYLLCSGAYVSSDFNIVHAYPQKMFCWGYFPETRHYDVDELMKNKGWKPEKAKQSEIQMIASSQEEKIPYLLWAARMIPWKHPELVLQLAAYLKEQGIAFHIEMVGGGELEEEMIAMRRALHLEEVVSLPGFMKPEKVREKMEKANVFLVTSDRNEGWGAVVNESMNSACAVVVNHMVGAAPYLVKHGENGMFYKDGDANIFFETVKKLVEDPRKCEELGRRAYETITKVWNAENAASSLKKLVDDIVDDERKQFFEVSSTEMKNLAPCMPAPVIPERKMWHLLTK